jgi:hypothetical protein
MNARSVQGSWGRGTEVQSPRSNVQSRRRPARVHPIPRRAVRCAARGLCTALKRGVNESGVCESCDNCDSFTNCQSALVRSSPCGGTRPTGDCIRRNRACCGRCTKVTKVTIVDSLAPARSALAGLWLRPNSFRRLPGGSSPEVTARYFPGREKLNNSDTYLTGIASFGRHGVQSRTECGGGRRRWEYHKICNVIFLECAEGRRHFSIFISRTWFNLSSAKKNYG